MYGILTLCNVNHYITSRSHTLANITMIVTKSINKPLIGIIIRRIQREIARIVPLVRHFDNLWTTLR